MLLEGNLEEIQDKENYFDFFCEKIRFLIFCHICATIAAEFLREKKNCQKEKLGKRACFTEM